MRDCGTLGELAVGLSEKPDGLREREAREVRLCEQAAGRPLKMARLIGGVELGQMGTHDRPASPLRFDVSLRFELIVSLLHSERRDDELFAEFAVRGEPIAGLQSSTGDGFDDLPHDLAVDGKLVGGIDDEVHYR